jgi:Protein of unknown function (DUF2937)
MLAHPFAFVVALALGFALSQAPEFAQQYRQRLGGAIDELRRIVLQFDEDSRRSGHDRSAALRLMENNPERLVRDQAGRMEDNIARYDRLRQQQEDFTNGGAFVRLGSFVRNFDRPLVQRTFESYEPAVPATTEGFLLAGGGFFVSYVLLLGVGAVWRRRRRPRRPASI